jgi:DNA-binding CsgD family transcriptional regulator
MKVSATDWSESFFQAALEPARWLPALETLADATGSLRAELVGFGPPPFEPFNWVTSTDSSTLDDFIRSGGTKPDHNFRLAAAAGRNCLEIVHECDYAQARRSLVREDYVEFCERQHMPFGCQTTLFHDGAALVGFSLLRSRSDGQTDEKSRRIFAEAAHAARSAVRLQRAVESQGFALLCGSLDAMTLPCLLLDGRGEVRAVTPAAEALLRRDPLLRVADRRLSSVSSEEKRRIELAIRNALGAQRTRFARIPLHRGKPVPELVLDLFRLPSSDWQMHFAPRAMVVLRDPRQGLDRPSATLAGIYSLTVAEAEIALGLAGGQSRQEIAHGRGVTIETLRAQIKSIYQKTGCSREAELILLVKALVQ